MKLGKALATGVAEERPVGRGEELGLPEEIRQPEEIAELDEVEASVAEEVPAAR